MDDGDLHEQILRLEAHIEELVEAMDRCRSCFCFLGRAGALARAIRRCDILAIHGSGT